MEHDTELDHLQKAHRRLKARLEELERRIQYHLAAKRTDPFADLVSAHSLHPASPSQLTAPSTTDQTDPPSHQN